MKHPRRAFTLIELLVVIGIILVLVGLLVMGFRHLNATAAKKETIAELHICRGLLTEYENHAGTNFISAVYGGTSDIPLSSIGYKNPSSPPPYVGDMATQTIGAQRYAAQAVKNTRALFLSLMQVPANRNVVQSIPPKRILEPDPSSPSPTASRIDYGVVLLDGWGNPIILVPPAGLHVQIKDEASGTYPEYIVRTSGMFPASSAPAVTSADRPFFASAGQDGDFTLGEDNVYSFQD